MSINKAMFYIGAIVLGLAVGSMAITLEQLEQKLMLLKWILKPEHLQQKDSWKVEGSATKQYPSVSVGSYMQCSNCKIA